MAPQGPTRPRDGAEITMTEEVIDNEDNVVDDDSEFEKAFAELTDNDPDDEYEELIDGADEEVARDQDSQTSDDDQPSGEGVVEAEQQPAADGESGDKTPNGKPEEDVAYWKHKYESDAGRVSALQRKINSLEDQLKAQQSGLGNDKPVVQSDASQAFNELKEDFPEIANAVQGYVDEIVASKTAEVSQRVKDTVAPLEKEQQDRFWKSQFEALDKAHPDWSEVVNSTEFNRWLDAQPEGIQKLKQSDYANDVSSVLNYFKSANGPTKNEPDPEVEALRQRREKQLEDATTVVSKGPGERKVGTPADFDHAFEHYASKKR